MYRTLLAVAASMFVAGLAVGNRYGVRHGREQGREDQRPYVDYLWRAYGEATGHNPAWPPPANRMPSP